MKIPLELQRLIDWRLDLARRKKKLAELRVIVEDIKRRIAAEESAWHTESDRVETDGAVIEYWAKNDASALVDYLHRTYGAPKRRAQPRCSGRAVSL